MWLMIGIGATPSIIIQMVMGDANKFVVQSSSDIT
jgi:hypothetical protein